MRRPGGQLGRQKILVVVHPLKSCMAQKLHTYLLLHVAEGVGPGDTADTLLLEHLLCQSTPVARGVALSCQPV